MILTTPKARKYVENISVSLKNFAKYFKINQILQIYGVKVTSRNYRNEFSKAYKILYKDNKLCYLTEILDSA